MSGITLDTGALVAFERNDRLVVSVILRAVQRRLGVVVPAGVVGQAWRDGKRQVRLVRLLGSDAVEVEPLDDARARAAGQLCGATRTSDVVDASVVLCARTRGHVVLTSDPDDLRRLAPELRLHAV
ncbi:MAG: PIN domain-containing protein [Myxococcales bacterium]|nr:PIN domain-containing protein [Myxococcales bacterium]